MSESFLFYDLETFGADPRRSRIAQYAAIRTNAQLEIIEEPTSFFVQPANDLLPSPVATLITGITPQHALREGVNEAEAFSRIQEQMLQPKTCTLGYNTLRFDDEFIRHGLFRNFHDPYEREWRGGNSRWDLLDMLRLMHALRPEGITWPKREDGATSFKLEHLALANGVREGDAHEALSDVHATIGLARLMRTSQPRLWDYALKLRDKRFVASLLDVAAMTPVLHVSQRYPASRMCAAPVLPIARHPHIDNRIIVFDLEGDPSLLIDLSVDEILDRLYVPAADLPEGVERVPLKEIHLNKSPAVVAASHLREADFERLAIDRRRMESHAGQLRAHGPALAEKIRAVFARERDREPADVDASIYDGFLADGDKRRFVDIRTAAPADLGALQIPFKDPRMPELLFRYRARNWPDSLTPAEHQRWNDYRRQRLHAPGTLSEYSFESFHAELSALRAASSTPGSAMVLLDQLEAWARGLEEEL